MRKGVLLSAIAGVLQLGVISAPIFWGKNEFEEVRLADGRLFRIEAVTFGTHHVVGGGDRWLFRLWKILLKFQSTPRRSDQSSVVEI